MDMEAVSDEWVQFNCTVTSINCNYTVWWFIAGYSIPIKRNNTVPGLISKRNFSRCTSSNQTTHFFEVLANKELDRAVFYCGAQPQGFRGQQAPRSCRCVDGRCYSKPALLTINTTTTSPKSAGISEVNSVPSPSCTVQGTTFSEIITITSTVIVTLTPTPTVTPTPTPTNCPNLGLTTSPHMQNSSTQATSVQAAVLAGLGIAAFILML